VREGSSFHLYTPENAVQSTSASIMMEQGTPTVTAEIECMERPDFRYRLKYFDTAAWGIAK